jgi:glycosyltransferase involved in cell wall biosynthesis
MARIAAIICTHNRAIFLRQALESLATQSLNPAEYEVVVVDNASADETAQVVKSFAAQIPNLRYIYEDRLGLSWARNAGAMATDADFVAYLDDDARAEPGWLEQVLQAFETNTPTPAVVGGRVWLNWDGPPPAWLPQRYWSVYTYLDHGPQARYLAPQEHLVGANLAFHRATLLAVGGFDPLLGRKGTSLLSGEEAAVLERLRGQHALIYYEPSALVWHAVPEARRRKRWLWARLFWDGASQPLLDYGAEQSRRFYSVQAYYDLRRSAFFSLQWCRALVGRDKERRLENALALVQRLGRLRTNLKLSALGSV